MNAFVLAAFKKFGGAPAPLVGLFTSDEEIGSPACRPIIEAEARRARAVFNSEPGRPSGNVVSGRKGGVFMKMEVTGKAAHSGGNYAEGISAIEELARKITALHAITDLTKGTTVNVGLISGGQTVNTVAPWAKCEIDLRYVTPPDREDAMAKITRIVETANVPGTSATLKSPASSSRWCRAPRTGGCSTTMRPARAISTSRSKASSPAAARTQASPRASARRPSARSARSAARRTRRTNF